MLTPRRTQKQFSERNQGNLDYSNKRRPWARSRFWLSVLAIAGGIAGIWLFQTRGREKFFSPGGISSNHAAFGDNCASCHDKSTIESGLTAAKFRQVLGQRFHRGVDFERIDQKCQVCHTSHLLHEPNVVQNRSCSACHQEHLGRVPMRAVSSSNCISCHNDAHTMQAASQKGMQLQWKGFQRHPHPVQQVSLELPRPNQGYTQTFPSFWEGHPEFQLHRDQVRDPDMVRFNHQRHFAADIPLVNGKKLDCNYCHKTDPDGRYYQRISFAANCQACHSLQFDAKNPELTLPHGNPTAVRGFLRSLPTQYAELAVRKGIARAEIQNFVAKQMAQLRERVRSGEDLERQVFFTADPYKPGPGSTARSRATFEGCAFCHQVKPVANAAPEITKPVLIDRWMLHARFDHAKHASVACVDCHKAEQSRDTSDVLMPVKANCVTCHNGKATTISECGTCHTYHANPAVKTVANATEGSSFKQMLLGSNR